ncbi:MAG TPA: putative sulfate exporter family transporter [Polyangia bacterium]|nr:putative sulfate exporter family transporter [Polyangia bacterium]
MSRPQWTPGRADLAGVALSLGVGAAGLAIVRLLPPSPFISDILVALLLGAVILNTPLRRVFKLALPSAEREPDRYAVGLRFTGKWILRAAIVAMGFKVQTKFFGLGELALIGGVALASLPSAFFVTHAAAAALGVRRAMADLIAGGTMICGASAVNALAPTVGARREEQGIAIGTIFLFSVTALIAFRPIAAAVGLDTAHAGLWSGLAVNDLSSAIAVGKQMGEAGGTMAAASKSARVVLLAPTLVILALYRKGGAGSGGLGARAVEHFPRFVFGYLALAAARAAGDRLLGAAGAWTGAIAIDQWIVDLLMAGVSAAIGLHLELGKLLGVGGRALAVGGVASTWTAGLTLAMIALAARGQPAAAALAGAGGVAASFAAFRRMTSRDRQRRALERRFADGAPLSMWEATSLLGWLEAEHTLDESALRRLLQQLHPSIGELIPVRESPLPHGEGCRWITYWEGASGWALVAVCREPGSATPIHAHPHRLLGKSIEGRLEELRFAERGADAMELVERRVLSHNDLVETDGLATPHLVRAIGDHPSIDLQLRGPEVGEPGRRFRPAAALNLDGLAIGARIDGRAEIDDRPGQGGEGAGAGRVPAG